MRRLPILVLLLVAILPCPPARCAHRFPKSQKLMRSRVTPWQRVFLAKDVFAGHLVLVREPLLRGRLVAQSRVPQGRLVSRIKPILLPRRGEYEVTYSCRLVKYLPAKNRTNRISPMVGEWYGKRWWRTLGATHIEAGSIPSNRYEEYTFRFVADKPRRVEPRIGNGGGIVRYDRITIRLIARHPDDYGFPIAASPAARELKRKLVEQSEAGRLTDDLVALYLEYADAQAHAAFVPAVVSEDFWTWLSSHQKLRQDLLVALGATFDPRIAEALQHLHRQFGPALGKHQNLAVAFAVAWGKAGDDAIGGGLTKLFGKGRQIPEMVASFAYYLRHENKMLFSLRKTPWPLLVHMAANDTPLDERDWVFARYGGHPISSFRKVYTDIRYVTGLWSHSVARRPGKPLSLPNMVKTGGVCSQRGYYANRVCQTLGVPGTRLYGNRHAWVGWLERKEGYKARYFGGYGRHLGTYFCPVSRQRAPQYDFDLLAAALSRSYKSYQQALIGCHIYDTCGDSRLQRKGRIGILRDAIKHNPYCLAAWRRWAHAFANGTLPQREVPSLWDQGMTLLRKHPGVMVELLETALSPMLKRNPGFADATAKRNIDVLTRAAEFFVGVHAPESTMRLACLRSHYLAGIGKKQQAIDVLLPCVVRFHAGKWPEDYGLLVNQCLDLLGSHPNPAVKLPRLERLAEQLPRLIARSNQEPRKISHPYAPVVKAYVAALKEAGRQTDARSWEQRLNPKHDIGNDVAQRMPLLTADRATILQREAAKKEHVPLTFSNSIGMKLVYIPPGAFMMGSRDTEKGRQKDEGPIHRVVISRGFYLGTYEVTVGQFRKFVEATGYSTDAERGAGRLRRGKRGGFAISPGKGQVWSENACWRSPGFPQTDRHPVVLISWNDAAAFCWWMTTREIRTYRLPTEAEWEYACRAGTQTAFWWGDKIDATGMVANVADQSARKTGMRMRSWPVNDHHPFTAPVGSFRANGFGLHDMAGNVWEWCRDWYSEKYYKASPRRDPVGPKRGRRRVLRGGGWRLAPDGYRSAHRSHQPPAFRACHVGFRVVLETRPR